MADGSIAGGGPRRTEASLPSMPPPSSQKGAEAASADAGRTSEAKTREPVRELIDKLERARESITRIDPALGSTIRQIAERADVPGQLEDLRFRTRIAYVLQDVAKLVGPITVRQPDLRDEMTRLAATSPGLQNERMKEVIRSTPALDDRTLIRDIRKHAMAIAGESDQRSPDVQSRIDVLENRVRLGTRMPGLEVGSAGPDSLGARQTAPGASRVTAGEGARTRAEMPTTTSGETRAEQGTRKEGFPPSPADVKLGQTSADQFQPQQIASHDQVQQLRGAGVTLAIMQAFRKPEPTTPAPWDQQLTPLRDRLDRYNQIAQSNRDEARLVAAERSGTAAVEALQAFANGPGAGITARIRDAARAANGGMDDVVAGMHEGGPYADLRRTFNAELQKEKGLGAALDRAAAAVGRYGADRTVADGIAAGRADAGAITARFEKLDGEIGKAASATPGRKEGKSQMEELGDRAAELASKAVEAIRAVFDRSPAAQHRASASPSPSPS